MKKMNPLKKNPPSLNAFRGGSYSLIISAVVLALLVVANLLATAAENEAATVEGTVKAIQGWVDCFDRCELAETIFAGGVSSVGDIAGHPALEQAYQSGKEV